MVTVLLPFGLSSAPFVFTKVVHPLVKQRHLHALEIVGFLDNCLGIAHQYQDAISCFNFVERTLINSDFVQNVTKSVWILCQRIIWLGMEIDINNNISSITSSQITSIFHKIEFLTNKMYIFARELSELAGKIISTKFIMENITQLKIRKFYKIIEGRPS